MQDSNYCKMGDLINFTKHSLDLASYNHSKESRNKAYCQENFVTHDRSVGLLARFVFHHFGEKS